jgi:hypothetical protein
MFLTLADSFRMRKHHGEHHTRRGCPPPQDIRAYGGAPSTAPSAPAREARTGVDIRPHSCTSTVAVALNRGGNCSHQGDLFLLTLPVLSPFFPPSSFLFSFSSSLNFLLLSPSLAPFLLSLHDMC